MHIEMVEQNLFILSVSKHVRLSFNSLSTLERD